MKRPRTHSIFRRLVIGLALVAVCSSLLLLGAVFLDYHLAYSDLATADATAKAWHEVFEHVLLPALLFVVPISLAVVVVIHRALAPLKQTAREMDEIRGRERGFRLGEDAFPEEVVPFIKAVNALLTRLDAAAAQQEAFAADVAHELRTPLALAMLELEQSGGATKERLAGDLQAMQRLIDQLLLLAQIKATESGSITLTEQSLTGIARDCVASLAPLAIAAGRHIEFEAGHEDVAVRGWREAIAAAIRNLIENALRVTPAGGHVTVIAGPGPCLRVRDEGPGLPEDALLRLVRRHERAEHASGSGAGLGLAIVDQIMAAHGGTLETYPAERALLLRFPVA